MCIYTYVYMLRPKMAMLLDIDTNSALWGNAAYHTSTHALAQMHALNVQFINFKLSSLCVIQRIQHVQGILSR